MKWLFAIAVLILAVAANVACGDDTPTSAPASTPMPPATMTPAPPSAPTVAPTPARTPAPTAAPTATPAPEPTPETGRAGERIGWSKCGFPDRDNIECGFIDVPADYRNPEADSIRIAVNVHRATLPDERIGYLLVNPGGPGASGLDLAFGAAFGFFTDEIVERFDIVGFDPRGVGLNAGWVAIFAGIGIDFAGAVGGGSGPEFACGGPGEQLALLSTIEGEFDTPEEIAAGEAAANLCIESMGPVGALLHSEYVARDMDEIRQALGAEQISYYGGSYGSVLGVWYATLFPDSVRAMVVDGADNPVKKTATQEERIAEGLEKAAELAAKLEQALTACADPECPIYNDGDPVGYYRKAVAKLDLVIAAADNNPMAGAFGVISTLYTEDDWPGLWQGLFELNENDDPSILFEFASINLGEDPTAASFPGHVNCLDQWVLHPELDRATLLEDSAVADSIANEKFPLLAIIDPSFPGTCLFYDQFTPEPLDGPLDGGDVPILVIGNTSDTFTSFRESEELVNETLSNGYLLETAHYKHGVYPENQCVNGHVHRALIDGVYPGERRVVCEREDWAANP